MNTREQFVIALEAHVELARHLIISRFTTQLLREPINHLLHLPVHLAMIPGQSVDLSQIIDDTPTDTIVGIRIELNALLTIVGVQRLDQPVNTGALQIFSLGQRLVWPVSLSLDAAHKRYRLAVAETPAAMCRIAAPGVNKLLKC